MREKENIKFKIDTVRKGGKGEGKKGSGKVLFLDIQYFRVFIATGCGMPGLEIASVASHHTSKRRVSVSSRR
jgi:hypothetical protein